MITSGKYTGSGMKLPYLCRVIWNVSYNDKSVRDRIETAVGKPFTLKERLAMKGIGSPRLVITECSTQIHNLLVLDNNRNYCNIELRPGGILVGFRSLLESYVLVIPYHKLVVYKGESDSYTIYRDQYKVRIKAGPRDKGVHRFIKKMMEQKRAISGSRIDDIY